MASKESQRKPLPPPVRAISGSENCNPNVISGSYKRKITKSSTAEESHGAPKNLTSQACAEFNLISPPRKHVCSSKRCASKNPDYAVPATANSKKFLASKRHVLAPNGSTVCKCCTRKSKGEDGSADDQNGSMGVCITCSKDSQNRRWSSDDSVSRNLLKSIAFSVTSSERNVLQYPNSGQADCSEKAFMNEAVPLPASEGDHHECFTDTPKSWNGPNDWPNLQTHHHSETVGKLNQFENSISPKALASPSGGCCNSDSRPQTSEFSVEEPASCLNSASGQSSLATEDDLTPSSMPENEEAAVSPSPEKSGNWRLNAVLQAFGDLSPTREGRVKTLVRAFESLLSVTERKGEQQARKSRCPLKFSYLSSNANLDGEVQTEDIVDGEEGESGNEEATYEEERVGQWQTSLSEQDLKDEETCDQWQSPVQIYSQSISVQGKENNRLGEQCRLQEQDHFGLPEEGVSNERECGMEKISYTQEEAQEDKVQSVVDVDCKSELVGEPYLLKVVVNDEKQCQSQEAEQQYCHSLQEGEKQWQSHAADGEYGHSLRVESMGDTKKPKQEQGLLIQSVVEEDGENEDKKKKPDEERAEERKEISKNDKRKAPDEEHEEADSRGMQALEKAPDEEQAEVVDSGEKQPLENKANKDSTSQEPETQHVRTVSLNLTEVASERQPSSQRIHTNVQQRASQKSVDGQFAFKASRKQQSSRIRESLRGSTCSISSTRPPLTQKSQVQSAQDKPRVSKPQPFKLLTEARGHIKEQEFVMKLRKLLEEEEKLRLPLAQGLPWTTDEPEIPYKPPTKENTTPWDVILNSDIRAMERADFDQFIAEKLLFIEQRRMEEECLRKAAEEEEIKKMRQEMVPKAQLMPYFDRPFRPRRSSKRPTIPKEPQFQLNKQQTKRQKCVVSNTT